jgi:nucleoside-diphosphate-sugar epimerase
LGGTGLVGAQVVRTLQELGIETISTSRDGRDGTVALDFVTAEDGSSTAAILLDQLSKVASGCTAVISCVGTVGTPNDFQVNAGTALAAQAAKSVGVERFVYISVAPEVKEFARDIEFLQDYMKGKTVSREAVLKFFPPSSSSSTLIEPTFIYGGGSFNVNPPRVAGFYGKVIEGLLSSSPIRSVERILSPGIIKIALEPPVSVESVASAAVAGALGKSPLPILDSYDKIKQAASSLQQI